MANIFLMSDRPNALSAVETFLRVEEGSGVRHRLLQPRTIEECQALGHIHSDAVVIFEPFPVRPDRAGRGGEKVKLLRRVFNPARLIAIVDPADLPPLALRTLKGLGVRNTLQIDKHFPLRLQETILLDAIPGPTIRWLVESARTYRSEEAYLILHAFACSPAGGSLADIARQFDCSERTLERKMKNLGLPTPEEARRGIRLIRAAYLLGDVNRTVEEVSLRVGYDDASSLRKASFAVCGITPGELHRGLKDGRLRECLEEDFFGRRASGRSSDAEGSA